MFIFVYFFTQTDSTRTSPPKICKNLPILLTLTRVHTPVQPVRGEPARMTHWTRPCAERPQLEDAFSKNAFFENFANFWRARSRLYQNEILQENMRSTAFFKLYKICILLHRCNLKIFAKNRFEKTAIFVKFQQKICKCRTICKMLSNFNNFSLIIW